MAVRAHNNPPIKNHIKRLREDCQWTQETLASLVGISRQSINSIERERYLPSLSVAMSLARAFNRSVEEVFSLASPTEVAPAEHSSK
jgi:putative transcriptional regulator